MAWHRQTVLFFTAAALATTTLVLTAQDTRAIDTPTVFPDGQGLPAGSGTVASGRAIYARACASCHGADGRGQSAPPLTGGRGSLASSRPLQTIGSFWPYATTLWDYVNRAMPPERPGSLSGNEVYAVSAYVLWMNGIIAENDVMSATTLPRVVMPNRNGFVPDPRSATQR
jgi:cytochrome c